MAFLIGQMEEDMKDNMHWIRSMAMEYFIGQMVEFIVEIGRMVNKTEEGFSLVQESRRERENGKMVNAFDGSKSKMNSSFCGYDLK